MQQNDCESITYDHVFRLRLRRNDRRVWAWDDRVNPAPQPNLKVTFGI